MNKADNGNARIYLAYIALLFLFFYSALVISDYLLGKWISQQSEAQVSKAKIIERDRVLNEDMPQRKVAIKQGYKPLFYPEAIDNYPPLKKLASEMDAAPLAGQPNSKIYFCNEGYGLIQYQSDRFGFRNSDALWDKKTDVVLIGDSFTHGACVKDKDTISGNLISKFNVLNLGAYGNHAIHYAAVEKTFIPIIKPKYAVTIFYANDNDDDADSIYWTNYFHQDAQYFDSKTHPLHLSTGIQNFYEKADNLIQNLLSGENSPDEYIKRYYHIGFIEKSLKYLRLPTIRRTIDHSIKVHHLQSQLPKSNLLAINTLISACKQAGCTPIIAYIPNSHFWRPDPRAPYYSHLLAQYCASMGVPFLDASRMIEETGEEAYAPKGPHLSPLGYRLVSKLIGDNIQHWNSLSVQSTNQ